MKTIYLLQNALGELFVQANVTGCITKADRYGLLAAVMDESLGREERLCIDRMLRAVRRGRLKMVDEISALT
ncbi:MAG: hypothetical protein F6K35_31515 [Okeania sp. SIO2H7]|nr:hypothetical protein [Okeania sp. SIO2H7]